MTLFDPMDCSMPGCPVFCCLPEFVQIHVHWIGDAIALFSFCPQSFSASDSWHQVAKELVFQLQQQSFQWIFRVDCPYNCLVWSCCPRDSQDSSPAPQFESISSLVLCLLYGLSLTSSVHDYWKDHSLDYTDLCWQVLSLLFNTLSTFVIAFLSRRK